MKYWVKKLLRNKMLDSEINEIQINQSNVLINIDTSVDVFNSYIASNLGEISNEISGGLSRLIAKNCGMGASPSHVIVAIGAEPGLTIDELSRIRSLDHSSMVRVISKLELKGLVSKKKNKIADARAVTVELTTLGAQTLSEISETRIKFLLGAISNLTKEEQGALGEIYNKIKINLRHKYKSENR